MKDDSAGPRLGARFDVKAVTEEGTFEGFASRFGELDDDRDRVARGAFGASLEASRRAGRLPPMLWQHDAREVIGAWRDMRENGEGLFVRGELFLADIPRAKAAHKLLKERAISGLSIGFRTVESEIDAKTGIRTLTRIDLLEVSLVTFPALDTARVTSVKQIKTIRDFEAFLRDAGGFTRARAKRVAARGFAPRAPSRDEEDEIGRTAEAIRDFARDVRRLADGAVRP